jgi:carboxyl-terminal processing protease
LAAATRRLVRGPAATLALLLLLPASRVAEAAPLAKPDDPRQQARALEQRGEWLDACRAYDQILRRDRADAGARESYLRCLRRYHATRRHRDDAYRRLITRLTPPQALDVYEQVLATVASAYVDRTKTRWSSLFRNGVEELLFALDEEVFVQEYFTAAPPGVLDAFRQRLEEWRPHPLAGRAEAREEVLAVLRAAQQAGLVLQPVTMTAVALEFACGACNALDEYTLFLTPGTPADGQAAGRGKSAGVGFEVVAVGSRLEVGRVYARGPAQEAGLARHDRIVRIDGQPAGSLTPEAAAGRLRGEPGSAVEVELAAAGSADTHVVRLTRRVVATPSVEPEVLPATTDAGKMVPVGLLRIVTFQETTPQEVREALATLQTAGVRVLIIDLRGNPGGAFKAAVQVAELFLGEGVIVIAQFPEYNRPFRAEGGNPFAGPLIVLIDGETASAAEVLAGALKEHRRATLLGQTTFGKGSLQCVASLDKPPLDKMPAAIRITVARLLSPDRHPYSGDGVAPDVPFPADGDTIVAEAKRLLLGMLRAPASSEPMGMPR